MGIFNRKKKKQEDFDDYLSIGGLMVSKLITEGNKKPVFIYREKRMNQSDSGWRIFSGYESPEYTENPDNTGIYNASTILKIDSSIKDLLLKGVGSVFERKGANSDWYEVNDYPIEDDYITKHRLTENWVLEINNLFERIKEEDGSLLYTTGDKSLRLSIWNDDKKTKEQLFEDQCLQIKNRDQTLSKTLNEFDFSDNIIKRVGYEINEEDGAKKYNVIYAFSFIDHEILQMAFYYDDYNDKNWAINTWKNITTI